MRMVLICTSSWTNKARVRSNFPVSRTRRLPRTIEEIRVSPYFCRLWRKRLRPISFSALTAHVTALKEADAVHETTTSNGAAQKEQANESLNGKKRKAGGRESTGIAKLKKANINGMSKLSSFSQKKSWDYPQFTYMFSVVWFIKILYILLTE